MVVTWWILVFWHCVTSLSLKTNIHNIPGIIHKSFMHSVQITDCTQCSYSLCCYMIWMMNLGIVTSVLQSKVHFRICLF